MLQEEAIRIFSKRLENEDVRAKVLPHSSSLQHVASVQKQNKQSLNRHKKQVRNMPLP